jgi:hypothetical protein
MDDLGELMKDYIFSATFEELNIEELEKIVGAGYNSHIERVSINFSEQKQEDDVDYYWNVEYEVDDEKMIVKSSGKRGLMAPSTFYYQLEELLTKERVIPNKPITDDTITSGGGQINSAIPAEDILGIAKYVKERGYKIEVNLSLAYLKHDEMYSILKAAPSVKSVLMKIKQIKPDSTEEDELGVERSEYQKKPPAEPPLGLGPQLTNFK